MSINNFLKIGVLVLSGVTLGYALTLLSQQSPAPSQIHRGLASLPLMKLGSDFQSRAYFDIKIENDFIAEKRSEASVVKVTLIAMKDINESLHYNWILNKDVLSTDAIQGSIDPMKAGESRQYTLRVTEYSKEIQEHISFVVSGQIDQHFVKREAFITSRPEDSFEYIVQKNEFERQNNQGRIQKLGNGRTVSDKFNPSKIIR